MKTVFVAAQESMIVGVYSTKELAQAAADEWAREAVEGCAWHRYDGAWRRRVRFDDSDWLELVVTESVVDGAAGRLR